MASYEHLYNDALLRKTKKDDGDFESQRMAQIAEFITRRWPGSDTADAAFGILVTFAIHADKPEDAEKLLKQVSAPLGPRLSCFWATRCGPAISDFRKQANPTSPKATNSASSKRPPSNTSTAVSTRPNRNPR